MIKHIPTERTKYSDESHLDKFATGNAAGNLNFVEWLLWDTSTEFIVNNGMPTDADVMEWIAVLEDRQDANNSDVKTTLALCREYLTTTPINIRHIDGDPL